MTHLDDHHDTELTRALTRDAVVEPGPALDALVRQRLAHAPFGRRSRLRPAVAVTLAIAAFASALSALAIALAESGVAAEGPLFAIGIGVVYLALSTAAVLPILMHPRLLERLRGTGVSA